jgi:hypothetical protein
MVRRSASVSLRSSRMISEALMSQKVFLLGQVCKSVFCPFRLEPAVGSTAVAIGVPAKPASLFCFVSGGWRIVLRRIGGGSIAEKRLATGIEAAADQSQRGDRIETEDGLFSKDRTGTSAVPDSMGAAVSFVWRPPAPVATNHQENDPGKGPRRVEAMAVHGCADCLSRRHFAENRRSETRTGSASAPQTT